MNGNSLRLIALAALAPAVAQLGIDVANVQMERLALAEPPEWSTTTVGFVDS